MQQLATRTKVASIIKHHLRSARRRVRHVRSIIVDRVNRARGENHKRFLNLGGGPDFAAIGWSNLEAVESSVNRKPFRFRPDAVFPFPGETFELVYSSHMLEHLDGASIARTLSEAARVLRTGGTLVVKVPDFERLLGHWRAGNRAFFSEKKWNIDSVTWTWPQKGVPDTIDFRAAYLFCGFWNSAWGEHFDPRRPRSIGAYNGPAAIGEAAVRDILSTGNPGAIAAALRAHVIATEGDHSFNHQTAWRNATLEQWIVDAGFALQPLTRDEVIRHYRWLPHVRAMSDISFYIAARKVAP